jgi:hypothetical protein
MSNITALITTTNQTTQLTGPSVGPEFMTTPGTQLPDETPDAVAPTVQVAKVSLLSPHAALVIDQLVTYPTVRGVRDILDWHPDPRHSHTGRADIINDPVWLENFARLACRIRPVVRSAGVPQQLTQAAELAASPECSSWKRSASSVPNAPCSQATFLSTACTRHFGLSMAPSIV